jgi:hypothetical protein
VRPARSFGLPLAALDAVAVAAAGGAFDLAVGTAVVLVGVWIAERDLYEHLAVDSDTSASSDDGDAQVRERIR